MSENEQGGLSVPKTTPDPEAPPSDLRVDPAELNQPAPQGPFDDGESAADGPGATVPERPGEERRFERTVREAGRLEAEGR
jgi:hypothetical protein